MKNILNNGDNLSLGKVILFNFFIMLFYMLIYDSAIQGASYTSASDEIEQEKLCFRIQLIVNLGITIWFVIKKSRYNWELMLKNMVILFFLHFIFSIFMFVSVN